MKRKEREEGGGREKKGGTTIKDEAIQSWVKAASSSRLTKEFKEGLEKEEREREREREREGGREWRCEWRWVWVEHIHKASNSGTFSIEGCETYVGNWEFSIWPRNEHTTTKKCMRRRRRKRKEKFWREMQAEQMSFNH